MFNFSFAELLLIVVVAVVFIGPKDLPIVIKTVAKFVKTMRNFSHEIKAAFDEVAHEVGVADIKQSFEAEMQMIKGDDGKMYESYQVPASTLPIIEKKDNLNEQ
jgi:Tat protein translocase TatB subunit